MNVTETSPPTIRTVPRPSCPLCGSPGTLLHGDLVDELFGAPGLWTLKRCVRRYCGLVWLDPYPTSEDIGKAYEGYHTHGRRAAPEQRSRFGRFVDFAKRGYLATRFGYALERVTPFHKLMGFLIYLKPRRRAELDFTVMRLPALPQGSLLDVGCGNGDFLRTMQELGWQVQGTDLDLEAVQTARADSGLDVFHGTLHEAKFAANSVDVVNLTHVIEHVENPLDLLTECARILRPGGRIVITTPNVESWGHALFGAKWRGLEPPRHMMLFSLRTMQAYARAAGFQVSTLRTTARWASNIFLASQSLARRKPTPRLAFWFQMLEGVILPLLPGCAEEIYLVGTKPLDSLGR